jgi:hypothetical protein
VIERAILGKKLLNLGFVGQVNHVAGAAGRQRLQRARGVATGWRR